jgi:hypothetical protein
MVSSLACGRERLEWTAPREEDPKVQSCADCVVEFVKMAASWFSLNHQQPLPKSCSNTHRCVRLGPRVVSFFLKNRALSFL